MWQAHVAGPCGMDFESMDYSRKPLLHLFRPWRSMALESEGCRPIFKHSGRALQFHPFPP